MYINTHLYIYTHSEPIYYISMSLYALARGPFYLCGGLSGVVGIDGVEGRAQAVLVREDGGVLHNTHRVTKKTASEMGMFVSLLT
jgi:hypothetical protein